MDYQSDIINILSHLKTIYGQTNNNALDPREQLKYYFTKHIVELPINLNKKWDNILLKENNSNPIIDTELFLEQIIIIKEDITQLKCDAIVNAANENGLGCFDYNHKCIDNIIHNKAGPMLRIQCNEFLGGSKLKTSEVIITMGFNLPTKYIIHTVGPIYHSKKHSLCAEQLAKCYINCLSLAIKLKLKSIAFCCISTGIYGFPSDLAAEIAIRTIIDHLIKSKSNIKVIFCVYTNYDYKLYQNLFNSFFIKN
jgi:O-acetyl-ADP-ribose deacetylase (regulator of RNase III)